MGHQLNFYALPADMANLERLLRETNDIAILHSRSETEEPRVVESLELRVGDQYWLYFYLVRRAELADVVTRHVPAQGYWTIDDTRSPVIQLTRSFYDDVILRRGRLWYVDGYYGEDRTWVEKSEAFRTWASSVVVRARKLLIKYKTDYIGAEAKQWVEAGGKLSAL